MEKIESVSAYISKESIWQTEVTTLIEILREANLTECMKWSAPCYTAFGHNVVSVMAFKGYFGLWFHQGVFLNDPEAVLINANEEKTKALRQWRMTDASEIKPDLIAAYISEAIELAKQGIVFKHEKKALEIPKELTDALNENHLAKTAFENLKFGQQREYADWISAAKRDETKLRRIAKAIPMIKNLVGLNDKYRK